MRIAVLSTSIFVGADSTPIRSRISWVITEASSAIAAVPFQNMRARALTDSVGAGLRRQAGDVPAGPCPACAGSAGRIFGAEPGRSEGHIDHAAGAKAGHAVEI